MNLRLFIATAALVSGVATGALAQETSSQTTTSTGTVFKPIVLTKNTDLSFGKVVRPATGSGVVNIAAVDGARTISGSGALITGPGGQATPGRATYSVAGEGGQAFSITVPANFNMIRSGGAETLAVTLTSTATSGTLSGALGSAGSLAFGVGGSIPLANNTATGAYTGTFQVTVQYN